MHWLFVGYVYTLYNLVNSFKITIEHPHYNNSGEKYYVTFLTRYFHKV